MTQPKILIVDDEPFNVDYLEQELEDSNCQTITASNGREALDKVRSEHPDLILLDITMPVMDGFAVLSELKADPLLRSIPVIVISAVNDLESVVKGIQLGAEDYLPKPFEPTLLHARISASLEKKILRDQHRKLLHTFASETVAEQLMANGFSLGGQKIDASIMFVDIRSFTSLSEKSDAADIIELLNDYFAAIFEPISRHGGVVNQIIGDGLMALFGVTKQDDTHQQDAVSAALDITETLKKFNEKQAADGKAEIKIGIGIASGVVVAGYAGTQHRATYTCVGDTVNLAARIETYTKEVGRPILFDAETRASLSDSMQVDSLGGVLFKGKTFPVQVYSVRMGGKSSREFALLDVTSS
jgi:class 3 adenylate cyclase